MTLVTFFFLNYYVFCYKNRIIYVNMYFFRVILYRALHGLKVRAPSVIQPLLEKALDGTIRVTSSVIY